MYVFDKKYVCKNINLQLMAMYVNKSLKLTLHCTLLYHGDTLIF